MTKIVVNSSTEWLVNFSAVDFDGIDDCFHTDAADEFTGDLVGELHNAGFEVEMATSQLGTCHGWNGANVFKAKIGPCGTFSKLSDNEKDLVFKSIDTAESKMRGEWCEPVS